MFSFVGHRNNNEAGRAPAFVPGAVGDVVFQDLADAERFIAGVAATPEQAGTPDFIFHVFDHMAPESASEPYTARMSMLGMNGPMRPVHTAEIASLAALEAFEARHVAEGWEGIIIRDPMAPYKRG